MSLSTGARLGAYEVLGPLGAGGMGEVYRARDAKLHRDVALKILPEAFAADPERLARFEREAHALAALTHPHIATIYGMHEERAEGGRQVRALVLEFVEGETLADRIVRGPMPAGEAIGIARQIADYEASDREPLRCVVSILPLMAAPSEMLIAGADIAPSSEAVAMTTILVVAHSSPLTFP